MSDPTTISAAEATAKVMDAVVFRLRTDAADAGKQSPLISIQIAEMLAEAFRAFAANLRAKQATGED